MIGRYLRASNLRTVSSYREIRTPACYFNASTITFTLYRIISM